MIPVALTENVYPFMFMANICFLLQLLIKTDTHPALAIITVTSLQSVDITNVTAMLAFEETETNVPVGPPKIDENIVVEILSPKTKLT